MSQIKGFLSLLLLSILLFSCSSARLSPEIYQRQWMLKSFRDYQFDFLVKNRAQLDLSATKSAPRQYRANMGCNQMFLDAEFRTNATVKFSDIGSTMMYCEDNMALEADFAKALPTMSKYKIEGHQLTLWDGKGTEMKFVAADWD